MLVGSGKIVKDICEAEQTYAAIFADSLAAK